MARADISVIDSPPGKRTAEGCCCTALQSLSLLSSRSDLPVHSPYPHSTRPCSTATTQLLDWAARQACAVCRQRRSGEVTMARSGTPASRVPDLGRLLDADLVQLDPGRTTDEHPSGVGRRAAVADQQDGGHGAEATEVIREAGTVSAADVAQQVVGRDPIGSRHAPPRPGAAGPSPHDLGLA